MLTKLDRVYDLIWTMIDSNAFLAENASYGDLTLIVPTMGLNSFRCFQGKNTEITNAIIPLKLSRMQG